MFSRYGFHVVLAKQPTLPLHPPETLFGGRGTTCLPSRGFMDLRGMGLPLPSIIRRIFPKEYGKPQPSRFYCKEGNPSERPINSVMCASGGRVEAVPERLPSAASRCGCGLEAAAA